MDKKFESLYHHLEETGWWFVKRREIIHQLIQESHISKVNAILEIGCSSGVFLSELRQRHYTDCKGIDISPEAIEACHKRGLLNTYLMNGVNPDFDKKSINLIIASDVLEHIKEDEIALRNWYSLLKPNGKLILFVPAFPILWSSHDVANHHFRRHTKKGLFSLLNRSGFHILRLSYWNSALFFPILFSRLFLKLFPNDGTARHQLIPLPSFFNAILSEILNIENRLLRVINFPIGVSLFAVAERGGDE